MEQVQNFNTSLQCPFPVVNQSLSKEQNMSTTEMLMMDKDKHISLSMQTKCASNVRDNPAATSSH